MKTTVELPDELYRRAKAEAALSGRRMKDLVEAGLKLLLDQPRRAKARPTMAELIKGAAGIVDSGIPDLGSNKKHLAGLGRDARGNH